MKLETVEGLYNKGFRTLGVVLAGEAEALEDEVEQLKKVNEAAMEIVKAVAHIGIDFGYGKYELESEKIDDARALCEANNS